MMNVILASLLLVGNLFGMEIIEKQRHKRTFFVPSLRQLCAEACAHYNLPSADIPEPCRDLIAQHKYYKEPLTKDNLAKILSVAKKRGDANKKEECRNFCKETTLQTLSSPQFKNYNTFQTAFWSNDTLYLSYNEWCDLQKSTFEEIVETTAAMTDDPDEYSILINDPTIHQQRNNYITKKNHVRRLSQCCWYLCPTAIVAATVVFNVWALSLVVNSIIAKS